MLCSHRCRLFWLLLKDKCSSGNRAGKYIASVMEPCLSEGCGMQGEGVEDRREHTIGIIGRTTACPSLSSASSIILPTPDSSRTRRKSSSLRLSSDEMSEQRKKYPCFCREIGHVCLLNMAIKHKF